MEFNDSHKQEYQRSFPFGVNKVKIIGFYLDKTDEGKEYVEVGFTNEDGSLEDTARVWFTTDKSAQFAFNTLRDILIHNVSEENKDKARDAISKTPNTESLVELLNDKLKGKEMWMTKLFDKSRTYESNGQTFRSINKNIYGYEPEIDPSLMPNKDQAPAQKDAADEVKEVFPGAEEVKSADPTDGWGK